MIDDAVKRLVEMALEEDLGKRGDVTGRIVPESSIAHGHIVARSGGTIAGMELAAYVLREVEPRARFEPLVEDGKSVPRGATIARIEGPARGVLAAERTLLNFLQRLSGIATATKRFVDAISGTRARIYDTRKTLPGWRGLTKFAVRCGGGVNNRMGLYDQIFTKDNHLVLFGGEPRGIPSMIAAARTEAPPGTPIEVEVTTVEGALVATRHGVDIVLLDNMTTDEMRRAVREVHALAESLGHRSPELEASGGVNLENVRSVAETGVDRVSVGWITHSSPALDLALDLELLGELS
ncbi:MAG TPA: carboxylating nicotinate-nucleotide diphosphorylase [Planctomycetota bacterium]|nr:carboxylating nicotinate-nucleotide diphosphorylase [Planctomycetota bacterium]